MPTVSVRLQVQGRQSGPIRALLDSGAQPNLIKHSVVQALSLITSTLSRKVIGVDGNPIQLHRQVKAMVLPWFEADTCIEETFWVLPKGIEWSLPTPQIDVQPVRRYSQVSFADPAYWKRAPFEILLGVGFFAKVMVSSVPRNIRSLVTLETNFGMVVFGVHPIHKGQETADNEIVARCSELHNTDDLVKQLWEMDRIGSSTTRTPEEQAVEDIFKETARRDADGRFVVTIPIKPDVQHIGDSRAIALRRFMYLERKLKRDPALKEKYVAFMREYESLGHMTRASYQAPAGKLVYYIPHHCVTKKFRVVFDCSCRTDKGISLNEIQQLGEKLQRDLFETVMRFRRHRIGFSADIKMMFRQVKIAQQQWDLQRIFWRESPNATLHEYWLTVVTYGMTSSAYNAVRALIQCGQDAGELFPDVERIIRNDFYMDDCVTGCDSEQEALTLASRLDKVLHTAGFELRKWKSNSQWLSNKLQANDDEVVTFDNKEQASVLGLQWLVAEDQFTFVVKTPAVTGEVTKRKILSSVAQLYDPNGYIAPVIILGKVLIQDIWRLSMDWDVEVPLKLKERWMTYWKEVIHLEQFRIDRWLGMAKGARGQLHGFSDASMTAYGAAIYLRAETADGKVTSKLVVAKTRVAPLKAVTIPRLELAAAELLGQLMVELRKAMEWGELDYIMWTDSMVVLHWLQKVPRDLKVYVANRVSSIQTNTDIRRWRHVGTKENPADLLSRGVMPADLVKSKLWVHGPDWLCYPETAWPADIKTKEVPPTAADEMHVCIAMTTMKDLGIWIPGRQALIPVEDYAGSLEKATTILGYIFHYMNQLLSRARLRKAGKKVTRPKRGVVSPMMLTIEERASAMRFCIKQAQAKAYGRDITSLRKENKLTEHSKLDTLKPVFDDEGMLRVGGRLERAEGDYQMRHPVIIPHDSRLAWLIIDSIHRQTKHGAVQIMMQAIRQRYWIPKLRSELRRYIHKCVTCVRYNYKLEQQLMSDLPADRVRAGKAFLHTGVDYAGPFTIKILNRQGEKIATRKTWVAIFVCLKTRAVHIDLVGDLTSVSFLACYDRFVSRRGHCQRMYSDNGTSFVGAAKEIKRAWKEWSENEMFNKLSQRGTDWIFMIPAAPHQGGIYEAAVKSMKFHLKRIVGQRVLEGEQFLTLLIGIEGILNSRPIHPLSDDPMDIQALTPGHFLIGEPIVLPPPFSIAEGAKTQGVKLWNERQNMFNHFWKRWQEEYLVTLQQRKKWRREKESLRIGQLVIIKSENFPPAQWSMGRICELIKSKDGLVRSVVLQTEVGKLSRPVQKICVLPVDSADEKQYNQEAKR